MTKPRHTWLAGGMVLACTACTTLEFGEKPLAEGYRAQAVDILFVVDNSASMTGEQWQLGQSFAGFIEEIEAFFGPDYHIAVITTGVKSEGCPACSDTITGSCMNPSGEDGRFQDRLGKNVGSEDSPVFDFKTDPACGRVITSESSACFYDGEAASANFEYGIALTGINGCGYERGLEAVRLALGDLATGTNAGFLRKDAVLLIVVITNEEDCGAVGDVTENLPNVSGNICYYAAKGSDPEGKTVDSRDRPLALTPVAEYYNELMARKRNKQGLVKFAAIVGVGDTQNPGATQIEYQFNAETAKWDVLPACTTAGCSGRYCTSNPGTRYIELARRFGLGENGFLDTICQGDFSATLQALGDHVACPRKFYLEWIPEEIGTKQLRINDVPIPNDKWTYQSPSVDAPNGAIVFAEGYNVCSLVEPGEFKITLGN